MPVIWHLYMSGSLDQSVGSHVGLVGAKWCLQQQQSQGPCTATERLQSSPWLTHCKDTAGNQGGHPRHLHKSHTSITVGQSINLLSLTVQQH